jgi:hypothetical protein
VVDTYFAHLHYDQVNISQLEVLSKMDQPGIKPATIYALGWMLYY